MDIHGCGRDHGRFMALRGQLLTTKPQLIPSCAKANSYPLVMTNIAMENHHFEGENSLYMAIFNSYVTNYQRESIPNETVGKNNPLSRQ